MNIKITLSVALLIISISIAAQTTKRVLFIGNSYTAVNNLPQVVANIANAMGDTVIFDSNTPGGQTLQGHSSNATSLNKIMMGNWDFVVLQEQSQLPSFSIDQVQTEVFPYAQSLDNLINSYNPCGKTMFYMTWGRKNGDASNCAVWPPVCTYQGMDDLLQSRYMMMTHSNNATVSPVAAVWKFVRENYPLIELYAADGSHPSEAGTYVAACSFYTAMFTKDVTTTSYNYTLSAADAQNIRAAAKTIVYDHLLEWQLAANFNYSIADNNIVTFNNLTSDVANYYWDFGDGNSSTEANPVHTYATNGAYTVSLQANYCTYSETNSQNLTVNTGLGVQDHIMDAAIAFYPNPVNRSAILRSQTAFNNATLIVYNSQGKKVKQQHNLSGQSIVFDRDDLPAALYFVQVLEGNKTIASTKLLITD